MIVFTASRHSLLTVSWRSPAAVLQEAFKTETACWLTPTSYVVPHAGAAALQDLRSDVLAELGWAAEVLRALREAGGIRATVLGHKGD